jgi:predicted nucleic acid-binding protein
VVAKERDNKQILDKFLSKPAVSVLEATMETAAVFGLVKDSLRKSAHPIPINDGWIAAHVLDIGSILVPYDDHFRAVPGLRLWDG